MAVRAIRGATQVDADDREQVLEATRELVSAVLERNELGHDDVISILFTATPDLVSEFPALAARELGMGDVPLMCATEIDVPHALPRVLRLMAHVETDAAARRDPARLPARRGGPAPGHRPVTTRLPGAGDPRRARRAPASPASPGPSPPGSAPPTSTPARCTARRPSPSWTPGSTRRTPRRWRRRRRGARIEVGTTAGEELVQVDGVDVADRIRGAEVTRAVSPVSAVPAVRRQLVDQQRALVAAADGRRRRGAGHRHRRPPGRDAARST